MRSTKESPWSCLFTFFLPYDSLISWRNPCGVSVLTHHVIIKHGWNYVFMSHKLWDRSYSYLRWHIQDFPRNWTSHQPIRITKTPLVLIQGQLTLLGQTRSQNHTRVLSWLFLLAWTISRFYFFSKLVMTVSGRHLILCGNLLPIDCCVSVMFQWATALEAMK